MVSRRLIVCLIDVFLLSENKNYYFRWEDGVPVGPFDSTENLNNTLLTNTRVIFATCIGRDANGLARGALSYGFVC